MPKSHNSQEISDHRRSVDDAAASNPLRLRIVQLENENEELRSRLGETEADASRNGRQLRLLPRFSLRLFLLAVTAFCVWLGYQTIRADQRVKAVKHLLSVGATVEFNAAYDPPLYWKSVVPGMFGPVSQPDVWERLKNFIGRRYFDRPVRVTFNSDASLDEAELEHLTCLSELVYLNLPNGEIASDVLNRIHRAAPDVYIERPGMAFFGIDDQKLLPRRCTITTVISDTSAEAIGIRPNDQLVRFDGERINNWVDFMRIMSRKKRGDVVAAEVLRGNERIRYDVTLGARP
jgi:hypothetical protein